MPEYRGIEWDRYAPGLIAVEAQWGLALAACQRLCIQSVQRRDSRPERHDLVHCPLGQIWVCLHKGCRGTRFRGWIKCLNCITSNI